MLREGEVLVKIEAAGVCGSDVHMWEGRDPRTPASHDPWPRGSGRDRGVNGEKRDVSWKTS